MKTLLVPIDLSPVTKAVVDSAAGMARALKGRLLLLHVIQPALVPTDYTLPPETFQQAMDVQEAAAREQLRRIGRELTEAGLPVETILRVGHPTSVVREITGARDIDLIVIGSHGHTAFFDLVFGSVAHGILRHAPCPVLVVPSPKSSPERRPRKSSSARRNR